MIARCVIALIPLFLSACAATTMPTSPQLPKVTMDGNRVVDEDYGYSIQIPAGWKMIDEEYIELLDPNSKKVLTQQFNRLIRMGLRATFWEASERAGLVISAKGGAFKTKEATIDAWRHLIENKIKIKNDLYNLEYNTFEHLTDLNASFLSSDGLKFLSYIRVYKFNQSIYAVDLSFTALQSDFDFYLPSFYDCVNSLSVSELTARPKESESGKNVSQRLEELKRLKDRSLITDEDYEAKKKQIIDEL